MKKMTAAHRHLLANQIAREHILADLSPPLGYPGGRCHVVERIEQEISNPRARQPLVDRVQDAKELDKSEEKGIYNKDHKEKGPGDGINYLYISPHAQYKMDLRSVTVPEVRLAVKRFLKSAQKWKEKGDPRFEEIRQRLMRRDSITYVDPQTKLKIVFVPDGAGALKIITTFWEGYPDPPKYKGECEV